MKKISQLFGVTFLFIVLLHVICPTEVTAEEQTETYGIHIIKYRMDEHTSVTQTLPINGTKLEQVADDQGNTLEPLAGISYKLTKVVLKEGVEKESEATSYEPATGEEAFQMTLVGNDEGVAEINGLTKGVYLVEELPHVALKEVMSPVVVTLPLTTENGIVNQVYIYPKSSVSPPTPGDSSNPEEPTTPMLDPTGKPVGKATGKLPQTSGNIGTIKQLYFMIGLIVLMGGIGWRVSKKKKSVNNPN